MNICDRYGRSSFLLFILALEKNTIGCLGGGKCGIVDGHASFCYSYNPRLFRSPPYNIL